MVGVLLVDSDGKRLASLKRHFERRFKVHTAVRVEDALHLFREYRPAAMVMHMNQSSGTGLHLGATVRSKNPSVALVVYGEADGKKKWSQDLLRKVDHYIPDDGDPAFLESLVWDAVSSRARHRNEVDDDEGEDSGIFDNLVEVLNTEIPMPRTRTGKKEETASAAHGKTAPSTAPAPSVHAVVLEPAPSWRKRLAEHFGQRIELVFVKDWKELRATVARDPRAYVAIIHMHGRALKPRSLELLRELPAGDRVSVIIHGVGNPKAAQQADVALPHSLEPPVLEVVVWEALVECHNNLARELTSPGDLLPKTKVARKDEEDVVQALPFKDILEAEASLDSFRRLVTKRVDLPGYTPDDGDDVRTWRELLHSDVSPETMRELLSKPLFEH